MSEDLGMTEYISNNILLKFTDCEFSIHENHYETD